MTWPAVPLPARARAILLLPAGMRAVDEDLTITLPAPATLILDGADYERVMIHHGGLVDQDARVLYILGGIYFPQGAGPLRALPDEAHDQ